MFSVLLLTVVFYQNFILKPVLLSEHVRFGICYMCSEFVILKVYRFNNVTIHVLLDLLEHHNSSSCASVGIIQIYYRDHSGRDVIHHVKVRLKKHRYIFLARY